MFTSRQRLPVLAEALWFMVFIFDRNYMLRCFNEEYTRQGVFNDMPITNYVV
jgi:hypothetical protein